MRVVVDEVLPSNPYDAYLRMTCIKSTEQLFHKFGDASAEGFGFLDVR